MVAFLWQLSLLYTAIQFAKNLIARRDLCRFDILCDRKFANESRISTSHPLDPFRADAYQPYRNQI
jgi:hypothetical protein